MGQERFTGYRFDEAVGIIPDVLCSLAIGVYKNAPVFDSIVQYIYYITLSRKNVTDF